MVDTSRFSVGSLSIAAYITWAAVSYAVWQEAGAYAGVRTVPGRTVAAVLLLIFLMTTIALSLSPKMPLARDRRRVIVAALILQVAATFGLLSLGPNSTSPVLLIILATEIVLYTQPGWCWALLTLVNLCFYIALVNQWHADNPLFVLTIYGGFQTFAALTARAMKNAQITAHQLRLTNAELLATRALLTESARDGERLRVSRELHDVVGHKLTALSLNLDVLRLDTSVAPRRELHLASVLGQEILADIRSVVSTLRRHDGIDLHEALTRLTTVFPAPRVLLNLQTNLRVAGAQTAEALLRCAQEGLTNAARHAGAAHVHVTLSDESNEVVLRIEDDGRFAGTLTFGNGLTGLRERVESLHGSMRLDRSVYGGCRLTVRVPQQL